MLGEDDNRIQNGFHDVHDDIENSSSEIDEDEGPMEESSTTTTDPRTSSRESHGSDRCRRQRRVSYDTSLPAQHSYLGTDLVDVQGRVVLDDDYLVTMPLLSLPGLILVPGQTLPLQLQHPALVGMMRKIISGDKVFGLTSSLAQPSNLSEYGTTAEIRSFSNIADPNNEDDGLPFLRIKAEGSQRFVVRETWRGVDGILMGKVKILSEAHLTHPFRANILGSIHGSRFNSVLVPAMTRLPHFVYNLYSPEILMRRISIHLERWASFDNRDTSDPEAPQRAGVVTNKTETTTGQTDSTPQSSVVKITRTITTTLRLRREGEEVELESDDEEIPVLPKSSKSSTQLPTDQNTSQAGPSTAVDASGSSPSTGPINKPSTSTSSPKKAGEPKTRSSLAPKDPCQFSYWVASNLPLEDTQRLHFLTLDCPVQRLRWLLSILQECLYLCCVRCKTKISRKEDIFSMSIRGPQGTYVNPNGYVYETLTVYKAESLTLVGMSSSEFSWFPGYAWTICQCACCDSHIGWKFTAMNDKKLQPEFFWGIKRSSIEFGLRTSTNDNNNPFVAVI